ncbi:hypothetical protein [Aquirufa antheringensis]|uniref:hypothetical protein n=1 Tax=Aquirufa antheringensis TaxID=2516559 RepID=UPI0010328609|nr:hypothetical protein [Aquirufa antheringensis]TBH70693.1 hypothetical protein EWU21_08570 [Aquirufa antheringensis]
MLLKKLSNKTKISLGILFWALIIAIPQFLVNYTTGLLSGKLIYGQIPVQFYLGLISGAIFGMIFYFIVKAVIKLLIKFGGLNIDVVNAFFMITSILLIIVFLLQGNNLYVALTLKEENVRDAQQLIKSYNNQ